MKNSTVGKLAFAVGVLGLGALGLFIKDRYFDVAEWKEVTIEGLPCPTGNLETPIWLEGTMGGFKFGLSYSGGASGHDKPLTTTIMVPDDEGDKVTVRMGKCHPAGGGSWKCANPTWFGPTQIATIDRTQPKLALTNDVACR